MLKLLIDTSVWLDIAKDSKQQLLLTALERLVEQKRVELIVPTLVIDEFSCNKARIIQDTTKSYAATLKRARDLVVEFGSKRKTRRALNEIENVNYVLPTLGEAAVNAIQRIERLLGSGRRIVASQSVIVRAAQRAIDKRAPFHRQRNGMADAILIETFADEIQAKEPWTRYAFVTHNHNDFSLPGGDNRLPHPDLAPLFTKIRSAYCISLGSLLKRIDPEQLAEVEFEEEEIEFEPRSGSEIFNVSEELALRIWYDRHQLTRQKIEAGEIRIIPDAEFDIKTANKTITQSIWKGAQVSARRVEKKFGKANLGPWTKFEWGMLNGKLSALRWCLGFEWDVLDS